MMINPTLEASAELVLDGDFAMSLHGAIAVDSCEFSGSIDGSSCDHQGRDLATGTWAYASTTVETTIAKPAFANTAFMANHHSQRKRPT